MGMWVTANCTCGHFSTCPSAADVQKLEELAADVYPETLALGGTISGEHGDGLSRTPFVRQQYADLYYVFRELKRIFDPAGILNPGKIVARNRFVVATFAASWLYRGNSIGSVFGKW